jgi:formiminotetrahydrofolate cyclodeaminase
MPTPVWESSLETFRSAAASGEPVPAGVAVAAVAASLALGLLAKVLKVSGKRKGFRGNLSKLESLVDSARAESKHMMRFAAGDMAVFKAYMASTRLPQRNAAELQQRKRAVDSAARKAIEMPVAAARAAASGIDLCAKATSMAHTFVAADLGAAALLLSSALRVFLVCADSNVRQLGSDTASYRGVTAGLHELERKAFRQADSVLKEVASAIEAAPTQGREP